MAPSFSAFHYSATHDSKKAHKYTAFLCGLMGKVCYAGWAGVSWKIGLVFYPQTPSTVSGLFTYPCDAQIPFLEFLINLMSVDRDISAKIHGFKAFSSIFQR